MKCCAMTFNMLFYGRLIHTYLWLFHWTFFYPVKCINKKKTFPHLWSIRQDAPQYTMLFHCCTYRHAHTHIHTHTHTCTHTRTQAGTDANKHKRLSHAHWEIVTYMYNLSIFSQRCAPLKQLVVQVVSWGGGGHWDRIGSERRGAGNSVAPTRLSDPVQTVCDVTVRCPTLFL